MNYQKYTIGGIYGVFRHCERAKNIKGGYIKYGNQNIDGNRTYLNYNLGPDRGMSQYDFLKKRLSELTYRKQKNNIVCCSWCVTCPKEITDLQDQKAFLKAVYDELNKRYNEKNVISAFCHFDEATPHMHYLFVCATPQEKLSASQTTSREVLKTIHEEMQQSVNAQLHKNYKLVNEPEERAKSSVPVTEMKQALTHIEKSLRTTKKQVADKSFENQNLLIEGFDLTEENIALKKQQEILKNEMNTLQAELQELKKQKYDLIGQRETIKREIKNLNSELQNEDDKLQSVKQQIANEEHEAIVTLDAIDRLKDEIQEYQQDIDYIRDNVSETMAADLQNVLDGQHIEYNGYDEYNNYDDYDLEL